MISIVLIWGLTLLFSCKEHNSLSPENNWTSFTSAGYAKALVLDGDCLWIAGGGVRRYDFKQNKMEELYTEDGLISNGVTSLAIDEFSEEVWLGTADGVSMLNKKTKKWQSFESKDGLAENWVQTVSIIRFNGRKAIWFGTQYKGISVLDPYNKKWKKYDQKDGLSDNWITCIAQDNTRGVVFVGTASGISIFNMEKEAWEETALNKASLTWWITGLLLDEEKGSIWCLTKNQGLKQYDLVTSAWYDLLENSSFPPATTTALSKNNQTIWLGTEQGLFSYSLQNYIWKRHSPGEGLKGTFISSLLFDKKENTLWCSTEKGIYRYDLTTNEWIEIFENRGLSHNFVNNFLFDDEFNFLWIATEGGGTSYYHFLKDKWQSFTTEDRLPSNLIRWLAMSKDKHTLWIGSRNDGVVALSLATKGIRKLNTQNGLPDNFISSIQVDRKHGYIWIGIWGSDGALCRYHPSSKELLIFDETKGLPSNCVTSISLYDEFVWVGTNRGIACYDTIRDVWKVFTKDKNGLSYHSAIMVLADKSHQCVWTTTEYGVNRYDIRANKWQAFTAYNGLAYRVVLSIAVDGDFVWFGTEGYGVSLYDTKSQKWQTFTTHDGLANNIVMTIAVDKKRGHVWFGTAEGGISRFSKHGIS